MTKLEEVARAVSPEVFDLPRINLNAWAYHDAYKKARAALVAMKYRDGADEEQFIAAAAQEMLDVVGLICAYDRVINAALAETP